MLLKYYKATPAERYKALDLFNMVYSDQRFNEKWFRWKYIENPSGCAHVYLAEDKDRKVICGTYSMFPWHILLRGEKLRCAQAGDLLIHPDYRRKSIFKELTHYKLNDLSGSDISLLIAFPTEKGKSFPGLMKFGWRKTGKLRTYVKIINVDKLLSIIKLSLPKKVTDFMNFILNRRHIIRCKKSSSFRFQKVNKFDEMLEYSMQKSHELQIYRDARYLKWRYIDKPDNQYEIFSLTKNNLSVCFIILIRRHNTADIIDIFPAIDPKNVLIALSFLNQHLLKKGVNVLRCSCTGSVTKILRKAGFFYREKNVSVVTYIIHKGIGVDNIRPGRCLLFSGDIDVV